MNFLDIFLPINISSADRARAFLWLVYHYLEGPSQPNPYDDDYSRQNPGKVPWLRRLTDAELAEENVDTTKEIEWGRAMSAQRNIFLQRLVNSLENEKKAKNVVASSSQRGTIRANFCERFANRLQCPNLAHIVPVPRGNLTMAFARNPTSTICRLHDPYLHHSFQVSQCAFNPEHPSNATTERAAGSTSRGPQRTMLQRECPTSVSCVGHKGPHLRTDAWHVVTSTDPLVDSDEELMDDYVRNDYSKYLELVSQMQPLMVL